MKHLTDTIRDGLRYGSLMEQKQAAFKALSELERMAGEPPMDYERWAAIREGHFNTASEEYFNARPHLDTKENRRIFYAGHCKGYDTPPAQQPQYEAGDMASAHNDGFRAGVASVTEQPQKLQDIEQYRLQMAGISTAAIGYWKESDSIHPDYDTLALRDVAKLYAKYDELYKAQQPQAECRSDGRCQYAIDHGAEGLGHCPEGRCAMKQPQAEVAEVFYCKTCGTAMQMPHDDCLACERGERQQPQAEAVPSDVVRDAMVVAGARVLNQRAAEACGVNADDQWAIYAEDFKDDVRAVLAAAQGEKP